MGYVLNVVSLKNKLSLVKKNKFEICRVLLPPSGWLFFGVKREGVNLLHSSESMVSIVSSVNSIDTVDSVRSVYMAVLPPCLMVFHLFNEGGYVIKIICMKASQHCNIMAPFQK